ncbi:butyrate kinase [Listeria sp. PSOL-1]|uniref:butyrate kinase n=1 Tax=Listeria sp. PSOL-1 TaxID=1844999 RepID=UPI0013D434BD|nr:butyrate kinase [Listeria sp. PSOL-1]
MEFTVLTINPGSTSTKVAVYQGYTLLFEEEVRHLKEELQSFERVIDQLSFRKKVVEHVLLTHHFTFEKLDAIVGRGGLLHPMSGGTYRINEQMIQDLADAVCGEHASNLGALIAQDLSESLGHLPAFIVDPVVVDEMQPIARITGHKNYERKSIFHALNHKATARKIAAKLDKKYEESRFIVAHLGGGISVAAHLNGKVVDVNNALDGEGPFSPERSGSLPLGSFLSACFSEEVSKSDLYKQIVGQGGMISYLDTNDMRVVLKMIASGNAYAELIFQAMAYQIAKEIGSYATVLQGNIDAIILTGGLARSEQFMHEIEKNISWIAPVAIEPGEDELEALNGGVQRVLAGLEKEKIYQ